MASCHVGTSASAVHFAQIPDIPHCVASGGAGWVVVLGSPAAEGPMTETRKLAAILVSDVAGYSRLAGADEDRTLARLRTLRSDLIDPIISVHHGRVVKRTGDGSIIEFRSVVDAVRCAVEVQTAMIERNAGVPPEKRIEFRVGIHRGRCSRGERRRPHGRRRQHRRAARGRSPSRGRSVCRRTPTARSKAGSI